MRNTAEVVIIGAGGAHGSAAFCQLAERGIDVLGIDQYTPPHDLGSSHGHTRITRLANGEGPHLTQFAKRSLELWQHREKWMEWEGRCYLKTGGLFIGPHDGSHAFHGKKNFVDSTLKIAEKYGIPHDLLSADEIRKRFPQFRVTDEEYGYYEHDAGILFPETCIEANYLSALGMGARFLEAEVGDVRQNGDTVTVYTSDGEISTKHCIISAGAYVKPFLPKKHAELLKITKQTPYWFLPKANAEMFEVGRFPVFIWELYNFYGIPAVDGHWPKVATDARTWEILNPRVIVDKRAHKKVDEIALAGMTSLMKDTLPDLASGRAKTVDCFYTSTPDNEFIIDTHPEMPNVTVVSACSGHGFKHSAAIGEAVVQSILGEKSEYDLTPFSFNRFNIAL